MESIKIKLGVLWAHFDHESGKFKKLAEDATVDTARLHYEGYMNAYANAAGEVAQLYREVETMQRKQKEGA